MAQYNIMLLISNLIMLKHFLVSLYLPFISWYHKLLTNNRWTVSVAFLSPKIDAAASFSIHQYFPNLHFSVLPHSASQHALTCSCLDDAEQGKGWSLIAHLPPLGSHRPGAPLPVPPAEPDPRATQTPARNVPRELDVCDCRSPWRHRPYLCCSPLHGINECLLRVRKSTRLNLPLYKPWLRVVSLCTGRQDLRCAQKEGHGAQPIPSPQGNAETKLALGYLYSLLSSSWCLAMPWKDGQLLQEKRECPKLHLTICYSLQRWGDIGRSCLEQGAAFSQLYGELATDM